MTRGTRAVHGSEVDHRLHLSGRDPKRVSSSRDQLLEVTCWCETEVVYVPQWELRVLGTTRSCGRQHCGPVDATRGEVVRKVGYAGRDVYQWHAKENGLTASVSPVTEEERRLVAVFGLRALQRYRRDMGARA